MNTHSMYDDVVEFHDKIIKLTPESSPSLISEEWVMERFRFLTEEVNEYVDAAMAGNIVGAVDGLLDTIYVALGTLHLMGVPVQDCWNLVQKANMAKVRGTSKRGNAHDAIKPEGWVGPEAGIAALLLRRINEA